MNTPHLIDTTHLKELTEPAIARVMPALDRVMPAIERVTPHHRTSRLGACGRFVSDHRRGVLVTGLVALVGAAVGFLTLRGAHRPAPVIPATRREPAPTGAAGSRSGGYADRGADDGFGGAAVGGTAEVSEGPFGPGSAAPDALGGSPGAAFTIKGDLTTRTYRTRLASDYEAARAGVWFADEATARAAGFSAGDAG